MRGVVAVAKTPKSSNNQGNQVTSVVKGAMARLRRGEESRRRWNEDEDPTSWSWEAGFIHLGNFIADESGR
jgi:hypothetical protein